MRNPDQTTKNPAHAQPIPAYVYAQRSTCAAQPMLSRAHYLTRPCTAHAQNMPSLCAGNTQIETMPSPAHAKRV
jgi:hypothetical protein